MGNSKSRVPQPRKQMTLSNFFNCSWIGLRRQGEHRRSQDVDQDTEISSKYSESEGYNYQQDSLIFDSDTEMSPNVEEEMLVVKSWEHEKERLRPPTYNAEDYAIALRRWGRRPLTNIPDFQGTLPSTASSSSGYVSGSGEMTLRQFTSVSELLNKLRADLRLAFPSFVQEFSAAPADGITLLLETLRGVQLVQNTPPSGQNGPRIGTRRAALDELGCVECLAACAERCADAPRLLSHAQPGLLALAVCLTSSLNRSRVLALQLLTKVCQAPDGHAAVSEAVSSLRLRYGEGGRFRFLAGALLAPRAALALRVAGISFLNAFLNSAPRTQTRLYIQAEACEAGLEPRVLQEWLADIDGRSDDALSDLLKKEVKKWSHNCVDVDALEKRLAQAEERCTVLDNKVAVLQNQIRKLQMEKMNDYNNINDKTINQPSNNVKIKRLSSNGEDEGISSSERSSSPENLRTTKKIDHKITDNDQETTIEDVIEELRIIVKDAEEEDRVGSTIHMAAKRDDYDKSIMKFSQNKEISNHQSKRSLGNQEHDLVNISHTRRTEMNYYDHDGEIFNDQSGRGKITDLVALTTIDNDSLRIIVKSSEVEEAIVPAILYPQPPRRTPPCFSTILATRQEEFLQQPLACNPHDDENVEEEIADDGSDSLLSASKLKYNNQNDCVSLEGHRLYLGKNGVEHKESFKKEKSTSKNLHRTLSKTKNLTDNDHEKSYMNVCRQFEIPDIRMGDQRPGETSAGHSNDVERKQFVLRSLSQDFLISNGHDQHSHQSGAKIQSRIKKFESLSAFDDTDLGTSPNHIQNNSRNSRISSCDKQSSRKIRRSESCHQVFHGPKSINQFIKGGSDSGLHYITDYELEPVMPYHLVPEMLHSSKQQTRSINKTDDGRSSRVDIVFRGAAGKNKKIKSPRSNDRSPSKVRSKQMNLSKKYLDRGQENNRNNLKNDELYSQMFITTGLKNDELYSEERYHRNLLSEFKNHSVHDYNFENNSSIIPSTGGEKSASKISFIESGNFLPSGRPFDAFSLGKNRFNAGKYSGNPLPSDNLALKKNLMSSSCPQRSKVTDILSGLY